MPRGLDSVLREFLGTYGGSGADSLLGLLLREWTGSIEFDLLAIPPPLIAESKTAVVAHARAIAFFRECVVKAGFEIDMFARAILEIDRAESGSETIAMHLRVTAETLSGEALEHEATASVKALGPSHEQRRVSAARRTGPDILALILLWLGLFYLGKAHAAIVTAPSLEWATDMSRWIGIYRIDDVDTTGARRWCDLTLHRVGTLTGQAPDSLKRHEWFYGEYPSSGDSLLVFDARHIGEPMAIFLASPGDDPSVLAIDREFQVHESPRTILTLVMDRLERTRGVREQPGWHDPGLVVPVPATSEAFDKLWAGSMVFLVVPPDSLEKAKLLASLDGDEWTTMRVACSLAWCYPDYPFEEILYRLVPGENLFTWMQGPSSSPSGMDTLTVPTRAIVARALEQARGRVVSESYYPMPDPPDPCIGTHTYRRDTEAP